MSTETGAEGELADRIGHLESGAVSGAVASLVAGAVLVVTSPATLRLTVPSMYALAPPPNPVVGFAIQVVHGAVVGVPFGVLMSMPSVLERTEPPTRSLVLGVASGVVVWTGGTSLALPLWLRAVGSPVALPVPNFTVPSLLAHAIYGLVLGVVYPLVARERVSGYPGPASGDGSGGPSAGTDTGTGTSASARAGRWTDATTDDDAVVAPAELERDLDYFTAVYAEWAKHESDAEFLESALVSDLDRERSRVASDVRRLENSIERGELPDWAASELARALSRAGAEQYAAAGGDRDGVDVEAAAAVIERVLKRDQS